MRILVTGLLFFCASALAAEPPETLREVQVGSVDEIDLEFSPTVLIGDTELLEVEEGSSPRQLRVRCKKLGSATLRLHDEKGLLQHRFLYKIKGTDLTQKLAGVRKMLQKVPGLRISIDKEEIVIEGELIDPGHAERVDMVVGSFSQIRDRTIRSR